MASVLALAPVVTGFPQVFSPAPAHPVKSQVRQVGFLSSSVGVLRNSRNATSSYMSRHGAPDPITTARAAAVTPVQDVAGPVTVVGVTWPRGTTPAGATYQIRTLQGSTWSQWQPLAVADGAPDAPEAASATPGTDPYVITGASQYEVRSLTTDAAISGTATVQVVDPGTSDADNLAPAPGAASAATTKPVIHTRAEWGADETLRAGKTPLYGQVQVGFVHHTADITDPALANSYPQADVPAMIRAMYRYHVTSLGWDDVGYNFFVDRFGGTWEGRFGGMDRAVVGAQTESYNFVSTGVAAIGNFDIADVPQVVTDAFTQLFAWKLSLTGIPATGPSPILALNGTTPLQRISGHSDGYPTICPGRFLYARLPEIWAGADAIIGHLPTSPTGVTATAGVAEAAVSWAAATSGDGSLISGYTVTASPGGRTATTTATSGRVTGLTNGTAYTFTVTATNGAGTSAASTPSAQVTPLAVVAAVTRVSDFTRDGFTDLITRSTAGVLSLYPGNGSGGFQARRQLGTGWNIMTALATPGDVTGDGVADILARDTAGRLWLYPGNGTGGLVPRRQIGSGWNIMNAITNAADLNRAGRPDILARDTAGVLWLYPLSGNAVFGARVKVGTGWNGLTVLDPGDFNGDGLADILARDPAGWLRLYRGNGAGGVIAGTQVSSGWATMTALITPGNWDRAAGNDVLARDFAGRLWIYPGTNAGSLGARRQVGSGWQIFSYIG